MKKFGIVLGFLIAVSATSAFANDGGVAFIDVKGIDPAGLQHGEGVKIHGGDAVKLFDLLPPASSAMPGQSKKHHSLALVSDGWNLFINCNNEGKGAEVDCAIVASKVEDVAYKYDGLGDGFPYDKAQVCTK